MDGEKVHLSPRAAGSLNPTRRVVGIGCWVQTNHLECRGPVKVLNWYRVLRVGAGGYMEVVEVKGPGHTVALSGPHFLPPDTRIASSIDIPFALELAYSEGHRYL